MPLNYFCTDIYTDSRPPEALHLSDRQQAAHRRHGDAVPLTDSTIFMDATGDGLANAAAWAAAGNGVLLRDPDNAGEITEKRQYVFCA